MRISDWSSDVCSSDLTVTQGADGDPLYVRMTTDGRLRPGVELRIVDDDGNDVETGTEGEVATRGPDMFLGYSDPALDAGAWLPGCWFLSGDIGRLDAAGLLAITHRKKDIIIRGGETILPSPSEHRKTPGE